MARAYKCENCGKLYEKSFSDTEICLRKKPSLNVKIVVRWLGAFHNDHRPDLCRQCIAEAVRKALEVLEKQDA